MANIVSMEEVRTAVVEYFDGKLMGESRYIDRAPCECCFFGLYFTETGIFTSPGHYTLWHSQLNMLGLDFLFDMPDTTLEPLRRMVASVAEERGMSFIPVSWNAFARTSPNDWRSFELVDRVGLECVARLDDKYYISGYDRNETPPLYFLARLPCEVATYAEAIEALKPKSVKLAEAKGVTVLRQGDMFAIPTNYTDVSLVEMGATFDNEPYPSHGLYGTAHYAGQQARLPDGTMFGRDSIMHRPPNRRGDHAPLKLVPDNGTWFLIVKNTVPIQPERR
jgi:hypothetical protein